MLYWFGPVGVLSWTKEGEDRKFSEQLGEIWIVIDSLAPAATSRMVDPAELKAFQTPNAVPIHA